MKNSLNSVCKKPFILFFAFFRKGTSFRSVESSRQIKAVGYLKEKGQITNKEYQELCDVSQPTANRDLQDMVDKSVLKQKGKEGQQIVYMLNF